MSAAMAALPATPGIDQHAGEARRQRQRPDGPALVRQASIRVDGLDLAQQRGGLGQRGDGRRIEKGERAGIGDAPGRAVEHQAGEVRRQDLRLGEGFERAGARFLPEPVADARLGSAGAAAPLVGRRAGDAHGFQPGEADRRLVARHAGKAAVDDDPHALDGQRCLGDGRGQHHLAAAGQGRLDREILRALVHRAVEGSQIDGGVDDPLLQLRFQPPDLALPGQEHQHGARLGPQSAQHGVGQFILDASARIAAEIARLDRKGAALA